MIMMMSGSEAKPPSGNSNKNDDEEEDLEEDLGVAEEASPISSRPPAAALGSSPPSSSSTRWPRQETLALLHIRSQMDSAFRDSSILKAPLWEHVSRKMEEMGYKRGAKKCKEKFENVQKYYKRTKERHEEQGRPDVKNYKFFSQLDALQQNTRASPSTRPGSSTPVAADINKFPSHALHDHPPHHLPPAPDPDHEPRLGFSTPSSSQGEEGDEMEMEMELESESPRHGRQKRKKRDGSVDVDGDDDDRMMGFIEGLMKEVMMKQEAMQQRFLDAVEKREQDRLAREEAWKRQDSARLIRDQQLMSHEHAAVASRDAAIIAFLQKITGQTINLPTHPSQLVPVSPLPPLFLQDQSVPSQNPSLQPKTFQVQQNPENPSSSQNVKTIAHNLVVPEQRKKVLQEAASSRWPKVEILALIQLRSNLESRYQESGPKGPLWEDITLGMRKLGYNRSAKRCKEKWENINKYYKKVKDNNKKRPEDSKTCPYFLELDALYSKKMLGNPGSSAGSSSMDVRSLPIKESLVKDGGGLEPKTGSMADFSSLFDEHRGDQGTIGGEQQQPVGIMRTQDLQRHENLMDYNSCDGSRSDEQNGDEEEDEYGDNEEQILKLAYNTQFKTQQSIGSGSVGIYHTIVQ